MSGVGSQSSPRARDVATDSGEPDTTRAGRRGEEDRGLTIYDQRALLGIIRVLQGRDIDPTGRSQQPGAHNHGERHGNGTAVLHLDGHRRPGPLPRSRLETTDPLQDLPARDP